MIANLPFNALRTFEAVARLRGFGRAAEELGVTQSAVSQQVKSLEEWLGQRLITRGGGRVVPTEEGARLAAEILRGFGGVAALCRDLRDTRAGSFSLNLSCLPGFAYVWLIPRLIGFDQLHPEIPVSITTTAQLATFTDDDIDIAIRYGPGGYSGLHSERLLSELLFPVCSPDLLRTGPQLSDPQDLHRHTLLVDDVNTVAGVAPTWDYWARANGVVMAKGQRQRRFGQSNMVIQAAERGMGVALGRSPLVFDALRRGTLVRPFPGATVSPFSYWLVCPVNGPTVPRIQAFRDWLLGEAAKTVLPDT